MRFLTKRPGHNAARQFISESGPKGLHLAMSGQIVREYLVVVTRPQSAKSSKLLAGSELASDKTLSIQPSIHAKRKRGIIHSAHPL